MLFRSVSHEAVALAGAWKLGKLVALYDDNGISIDGQVQPWYVDDAGKRFEACGWSVIGPVDGHDAAAVAAALAQARQGGSRPVLIICKTTIGKGSPNRAGTAKAHGEPLGAEEIKLTRDALGWKHEPFVIPPEVYDLWSAKASGQQQETVWNQVFAAYKKAHPDLAAEFLRRTSGQLPAQFDQIVVNAVVAAHQKAETVASRKASQIALTELTAKLPELLGGDRKSTRLNSSHIPLSRMPSSA